MGLETSLDLFHAKVRESKLLQYFTAFNRVILAVAFIPSGFTKLLGNRFTMLPTENPVGMFFEAFYQTGGWYRFVGFCQVLAAILLLIPRTSTLGAVIFFPIVLNIAIITIAVGFQGTWVITSLMFLANLYLLAWDYDKIKPMLPFSAKGNTRFNFRKSLPFLFIGGFGGVFAFIFFAMVNKSFSELGWIGPAIGLIVGTIFGLLNSIHFQKN